MSGAWMKAARRFTGYDGTRRGDLSSTSKQAVRAVLNRLAQRANDAGVVAIYTADLVQATGYSERAVKYAIRQLLDDGWLWRAVRGQGSRSGDFRGTPAPSVYVLRPMPQDDSGTLAPGEDYLRTAWTKHALSASYRSRPDHQRHAIRDALTDAWTPGLKPVDNPRPTGKEGTTYRQPVASSVTSRTSTTGSRRTGHLRPVPDLVIQVPTTVPVGQCLRPQWVERTPDFTLPTLVPFTWKTKDDRLAAVGT